MKHMTAVREALSLLPREDGVWSETDAAALAEVEEWETERERHDAEERSRSERFTVGQTFQEHVDRWLASNRKDADDVMWARFPLGMVGNVIERATERERSEGREGMVTVYRYDGSYAGCMGVERWERVLADEAERRRLERENDALRGNAL